MTKEKKVGGRKDKTILYWRQTLKESGIDPTQIEELSANRKEWKKMVNDRIEHIHKYEETLGKKYTGERMRRKQRKETSENELLCKECGKLCKSKGGLANHKRLIHKKEDKKNI